MGYINSIMSTALANTGEADLDCYADFMDGPDGEKCVQLVRDEFKALKECQSVDILAGAERCAEGIIGFIDDRIGHADRLINGLTELRDQYVDRLGIPRAMHQAASELRTRKNDTSQDALMYGFELTAGSDRTIPDDLYSSLRALGMPVTHAGRSIKTYRDAYHSAWMERRRCIPRAR